MKLSVTHQTKYQYSEPVTLGHNQLRLSPRSFHRQRCLASSLEILPKPTILRSWLDPFNNQVTYFTLEEPHLQLTIRMHAKVDVLPTPDTSSLETLKWEVARDQILSATSHEELDALLFTFDSPLGKRFCEVHEFASVSFPSGGTLFAGVLDLTRRIHTEFTYDPQATTVNTTVPELLQIRRGVCQDFAHLQITALRSLGLAARYVSGYLETRPPLGKPKLIGSDASHAWVSVYFPGCGWYDFDPTNNCLVGDRHITLAWGRDYSDVSPITGLYLGGGSSTLHVAVDVEERHIRFDD